MCTAARFIPKDPAALCKSTPRCTTTHFKHSLLQCNHFWSETQQLLAHTLEEHDRHLKQREIGELGGVNQVCIELGGVFLHTNLEQSALQSNAHKTWGPWLCISSAKLRRKGPLTPVGPDPCYLRQTCPIDQPSSPDQAAS